MGATSEPLDDANAMTSTNNGVSWQCGNILLILWKASMDRFDAMAVLLAVVDAGSLSAGARRLNAPLATVSRKVADLEKHLGVRLVVRTRRGLALDGGGARLRRRVTSYSRGTGRGGAAGQRRLWSAAWRAARDRAGLPSASAICCQLRSNS